MDIYIDFDGTLYNTTKLKEEMLKKVAEICCENNKKLDFNSVFFECQALYSRDKIYHIYELCNYMASKYSINIMLLHSGIDDILQNGKKLIYEDTIYFLNELKQRGYRLNLLTYTSSDSLDYQKKKVLGSTLQEYFDKIIYTTTNKFTLDIDYQNSVFLDDNPKELAGLCFAKAMRVIRIKRQNGKYSKIEMNNNDIVDCYNLKECLGLMNFDKYKKIQY